MKDYETGLRRQFPVSLLCLWMWQGGLSAFAADNAALISVSIPAGTQVMPRTMFTQTWTVQNTGTTTWSPGQSGCTLNIISKDSLGAVPLTTNTHSSWYIPAANIGDGQSVAPGAQATFSMSFIAPETSGSVTDTFQLNSASGAYFGPALTIQVVVLPAGSTNQYDRSRAVSYANNYVGYVCGDGYFWTNGSSYYNYGVGSPVPTNLVGDDCAHFVSCCIGNQAAQRGGGINVPSRVPPTYGEPGAQHLIYTTLIAAGYAAEVSSLSQMSPGDLIGWNWSGNTNTANIDHVTLYLGNGLIAAHAASHLDVSIPFYQAGEPGCVYHLIHIFDAPTLNMTRAGADKMVFSWGTNWTGYSLYSASSPSSGATWTRVAAAPVKIGAMNVLTNTMASGPVFYRLMFP